MPAVDRVRRAGATTTVVAYGEVLFAPGADVYRFTARLRERIAAGVIAAAPSNKRPRWAYYGKPLKSTIKRSVLKRHGPTSTRLTAAVGSTAPYALYVDQGTGIYNGGSPYPAKIIPPYTRGGPSLYESTWRPGGPRNPQVRQVYIRGQRGQEFFEAGIAAGFRSMQLRSYQVPGEGASAISGAIGSIPESIENFLGNTPADAAFIGSLQQWRAWRDAAFNSGRDLRTGTARVRVPKPRKKRTPAQNEERKRKARERAKRHRDKNRHLHSASTHKPKPQTPGATLTRSQDRARVKALAIKRFGAGNVTDIEYVNGKWQVTVFEPRTADRAQGYKSFSIKAKS